MAEEQEQFTEEELANLDNAEREALGLNDDDDQGVDVEAEVDTPEVEQDDSDNSVDDDDNPSADDTPEPDEAEPEPEPEPEPAKEEPAKPAEEAPAAEPEPVASERLTALDTEIEALGDKVEDGEMDFREYNKSLQALNNERQNLVVQINDEQNAATQRASDWNTAVDSFLTADEGHKAITDNPIIKGAFETALHQVSTSDEGRSQSNEWRLNAAKEALEASGIKISTNAKPAVEAKAPESRKPTAEIPQTLGNAPAATSNDASEFSNLAGLEGVALEEALSKLTLEQANRYLES